MRNILLVLILGTTISLNAQKEVVQFLKAPDISEPLLKEYLNPLATMVNNQMNAGWYHTAKTNRFLGFDLSISVTAASVPTTERGFYLSEIEDFEQYYLIKASSPKISPNIAGVSNALPVIKNISSGYEFQLPNGEDIQRISVPIFSFGLGLPYKSQVNIRFSPKTNYGELGKINQYGVSLKHSIKDYIPAFSKVPALSLSLLGSLAMQKSELDLEYVSEIESNQNLIGKANNYSLRIIVGWDVRILSAYMGVGYGSSKINYDLKGRYFVGDPMLKEEIKDPLNVNYTINQINYNFGLNAKIGFLNVFFEIAPHQYQTINFGAGYSFR